MLVEAAYSYLFYKGLRCLYEEHKTKCDALCFLLIQSLYITTNMITKKITEIPQMGKPFEGYDADSEAEIIETNL